jgi:hypothetical protein
VTEQPTSPSRARYLGWALALALFALPVVWLDVYLLSTEDASAEYVVGRYSLLLGAASVVALVVERLRHLTPWAALAGTVLALAAAGMPGAHRPGAARVAVLLVVTTGVGLLGLA